MMMTLVEIEEKAPQEKPKMNRAQQAIRNSKKEGCDMLHHGTSTYMDVKDMTVRMNAILCSSISCIDIQGRGICQSGWHPL